jgi:hypothetical protein
MLGTSVHAATFNAGLASLLAYATSNNGYCKIELKAYVLFQSSRALLMVRVPLRLLRRARIATLLAKSPGMMRDVVAKMVDAPKARGVAPWAAHFPKAPLAM